MADAALRPHVSVLTYHSIDGSGSPVSTAAPEFARQMSALASAGWRTLTPADFIRGHRAGGWPARTFLLSFDDGYRSLFDEAMPIAAAHAFTGVVFVATERVGGIMSGRCEPSAPLLDWPGLRAVAAAGWSVASHGCSHRPLSSLPAAEVERELADSRAIIEDRIGAPVTTLAYPYGAKSPDVERVAAARYDAAFGTVLGRATRASRAAAIERIDAYYLRGMPLAGFDGVMWRLYLALRRVGRAVRARSVVNSEG